MFIRLVSGITALVGDPFAALSNLSNPSAMYKCLVCDKPVSIQPPVTTTATTNNNINSYNFTNNNIDNNTYASPLVQRYDDLLSLDDQQRSNILHSPIKKPNLLSSPTSLRQLSNPSSVGSPSTDLPLPPVIASPGVSFFLNYFLIFLLFYYFLFFYIFV